MLKEKQKVPAFALKVYPKVKPAEHAGEVLADVEKLFQIIKTKTPPR